MTVPRPLSGLRVIECAGWNGVLAGRLLADGGAAVVRIVPPSGDPLAGEPPFLGAGGPSIQETWYNAGKLTLTLDPGTRSGRAAFLRLVRAADILVEDWPPGAAPFAPGELEDANPALTRVSVTPMGLDGPLAGWKVNDLVANALCGSASVTGNASTPPLSGYGNQSHHTVGLYVAVCALAAHRAARATGTFQHVDLSAHEALVSCTEQVLMEWFFPDGTWKTSIAPRQGSLHWSGAYEVYTAADGHGVMVTASLKLAEVLVPWLIEEGAAQGLADREKYPNVVAMVRNLPYVMTVLREWVASRNGEELFFEAQRRHQPFGVVWNIQEALTKSPQIAARGYLREQDVPGFGSVPFPGRFFRTGADGPHPAPGRRVEDAGWRPRERLARAGGVPPARPLEGVRVMDFTHVLAGPFGTRVLGDLGADVIKVGTAARGGGANAPDHPYYICWNRNKRSVTINMGTGEGRRVARLLAAKSDVIIENFRAGVLERWGLGYKSLAAAHPGVSVISMGGMGQDGPWKDFVTYAPTIHALTGLTYLTNPPGEHTLGYGFSLTDHLSGLAAALAALEALEYRERTGSGLSIDLSQYELGLGIMAPALLDYLANGRNPEPVGNRHPFGAWAPHGIYRCAGDDQWVAIAVRGEAEWGAFAELMGRPELRSDPRFATHAARLANAGALDASIEAWTGPLDRYEVARRCQAAGIAAGPVQDAADLTGRDEQLAAREFFGTATAEGRGTYGIDRFPARFNGLRPPEYQGVHQAGADTFAVVTELLGLPDDEVASLLASGALS
ncbi:MAG: putative CoA-transferase [Dehalococcoidia bacterium]